MSDVAVREAVLADVEQSRPCSMQFVVYHRSSRGTAVPIARALA